MKRKKMKVSYAALSIVLLLSTGCSDSMQTEEEIVVLKETQSAEEEAGWDEPEKGAESAAREEGGIAQLVQAPDSYIWEGGSENFHIKVDAPVVLPKAEGFKSYRVTSRVFTQEDYDNVNRVLLNGGSLWNKDYEKMQASYGFAASETGEPFAVEIPALVSYRERQPDETNVENADKNWLYGFVTVEDEDFFVVLDNDLREDWRWISFSVRSPRILSNYYPIGKKPRAAESGISVEAVTREAKELMEEMEFEDFEASAGEYFYSRDFTETSEKRESKCGYGIHFTRVLDGIPVTYTDQEGTTIEADEDCSWPYESVTLVFDQEGFSEFVWTDPYEVEKLSDEYVFLLPFSEIQEVFEEMLLKKYEDFWGYEKVEETLHIDEVRLGYMRIMEKGRATEGMMVPVWDFFGSEMFYDEYTKELVMTDGVCHSLLTINAMDGTIIDRNTGY